MRSRFLPWLETILLAIGLVLVLFYAGARLDGFLSARAAMRSFTDSLEQQTPPQNGGHRWAWRKPDFTAWSAKRIEAFERNLTGQRAEPVAILRIPRVGLEAPVFKGTDPLTLNRGVGWIEGTAAPDEPGNFGIAGHRDGFFRSLKDLARGDTIELVTRGGVETYVVDQLEVVPPTDVSVLQPRSGHTITLVTCYPFYFIGHAPKRYVVEGKLTHNLPHRAPADAGKADSIQGGVRQ